MNIPECLQYITTNVVSLKCSKMNETNSTITELMIDYEKWKKTHISHKKGNWRSSITLFLRCLDDFLYILYLVAGVVQSLSHIWLFETPWTTACQAPLSFTIS